LFEIEAVTLHKLESLALTDTKYLLGLRGMCLQLHGWRDSG
jgi:hypothetical protein